MPHPDTAALVLTIDLDAVVDNWRRVGRRAGRAHCAAVVKADAYGLGAARVAPALAAAGCRTFFVATLDEGLALRPLLPGAEILVLGGPLPGGEAEMLGNGLIPVLNSLEQVARWRAQVRDTPLPAALHLDTGMSRLGLEPAEVMRLAAAPALLDGLRITLVMSHMACADSPGDEMNGVQLSTFGRLAAMLPAGAPRSLAASSTVFLGEAFHFDMVRPGSALYGVNPTPGRANPMAPTVRLEGKILQVRDVDTPMTVGYGASHRVTGRGRVATVAVGYADGWFRTLGNRGHGVIEGERVPVVGRISMDLTTFDVTGLSAESARPGAVVELLGPTIDVDTVAAEAGTIGYEILTALSRRAARVYIGGAA